MNINVEEITREIAELRKKLIENTINSSISYMIPKEVTESLKDIVKGIEGVISMLNNSESERPVYTHETLARSLHIFVRMKLNRVLEDLGEETTSIHNLLETIRSSLPALDDIYICLENIDDLKADLAKVIEEIDNVIDYLNKGKVAKA